MLRLARRTADLLRRRGADLPDLVLDADDLLVVRDWLGPGYGHPTAAGRDAQTLAADHAALMLEPVYTAKALAAVLAMNADGRLGDGVVLFLNTNGPR